MPRSGIRRSASRDLGGCAAGAPVDSCEGSMRARVPRAPRAALGPFEPTAELRADDRGEVREELVAVAVVEPAAALRAPAVVPGAIAAGEPHLVRGGLAVQDEARAVGELERDDAVGGREVELVGIEALEPLCGALEAGVGEPRELRSVHPPRLR